MLLERQAKVRQPSPREAIFINEAREQHRLEQQELLHTLQAWKDSKRKTNQRLMTLHNTLEDLKYEAEQALQHHKYILMLTNLTHDPSL
jgi:hypothetical protein